MIVLCETNTTYMKKIILITALIGLLIACGSKGNKEKKGPDTDTTKQDTTSNVNTDNANNSGVRDNNYYASNFKNPNIEDIQLKQKKLTDHSEDLEIHISNYVTNANEVGFDELTFSTVNPKMYMGEQKEK